MYYKIRPQVPDSPDIDDFIFNEDKIIVNITKDLDKNL